MGNPLFNQFNNMPINDGGLSQFVSQVRDFRKSFQGNPRDEVQRLLNSGQMSQSDFNRYAQIANRLADIMGDY